jgi:DNA-binding winged helix-turn-helix (wHTH) protein
MNRLWGDAAVEESNLIQNIYVLKKVLGDTLKNLSDWVT